MIATNNLLAGFTEINHFINYRGPRKMDSCPFLLAVLLGFLGVFGLVGWFFGLVFVFYVFFLRGKYFYPEQVAPEITIM